MMWQFLAAALAYAAVLESSIETFVHGSPVRWWVAAMSAVYTGVTALCWRRISWHGKTVASALVLTGMLAVTAWLPRGLEDGVRLLGLSTPKLLTLAVATGVSVGAFVLWHSTRVPLIVRAAVVALGAYTAIAFVYAVATGIAFTSLFSRARSSQGLPFLFQGAVVAGLIVLPAALLVAVIRLGTRHPRPGSAGRSLYQVVALATTFAIVLSALPQRMNEASTQAASTGAGDDTARRLAILDNSLRAIEDGDRESPRDRWDPAYIVEQVGKDPQALFDWVRDNTFWIPYRGVLRGPVGVLMDRQGNSLDRALLLARLLEVAGHTVRLAHGEISRKQALDLLPDLVARHSVPPPTSGDADLEADLDVRDVAAQYQLDGEAIDRRLDAQANGVAQIILELQTRAADQAARLRSIVARPDADAEWLARYQTALDALRDHWWVQREEGGAWADLDLFAPAGVTSKLVTAQDTMAPNAVPSELRHDVAVRVVVEHGSNRGLAESRVLEHVLRPSELFGQAVVLQFWPRSWPRELAPDPNSQFGLKAVALEQREWTAALLIGRDVVAQTVIRDRADSLPEPPAGNPFGGLGGAIGNLARESQPSSAPVQELTAAWIEYEIRAAGGSRRSSRRAVFDLLGTATRSRGSVPELALTDDQRITRSLALMMRTEMLAAASDLSPEFVSHLSAQSLVSNRDLLRAVARDEIAPGEAATEQLLANAAPAVTPLYALALARTQWSRMSDRLYRDRVGIFTRHRYPAFVGQGLILRDAIDIVANEMGVTLAEPDAFAIRLEQGVFDTNAEALLHTNLVGLGNTGEAFKASQNWVAFTRPETDGARKLDLPADAQRAIAQDLERGYAVIAPQAPVEIGGQRYVGWWRIDPATGDTLGVAASGWGQSMTERGVQYNALVEMAKTFAFEYAFCQAVPQVANQAVVFLQPYRDELPPWLPPLAQAQDARSVYNASKKGCLIGAMIGTGVTATLPMLLMFLRGYAARLATRLGPFWRDQRGGVRIPPGSVKGPVRGGPPVPEAPAGNPGRGPESGVNPFGKTQPDLSKTQADPGAAPPSPPGPPNAGRPPTPLSPEAAQQNLKQAAAAQAAAGRESNQATQDFVRYRANKPNPARGHEGDPSKWDPLVDEALHNESLQKSQQNNEAISRLKEAQQAARDAAAAARRAQGKGGFPPPQAPRSPNPGCPPNCAGNANPTGPAGAVRVIVGGGGLSGGGS